MSAEGVRIYGCRKYDRICNLSGKRTEQIVYIICIKVLSGKSSISIGFFLCWNIAAGDMSKYQQSVQLNKDQLYRLCYNFFRRRRKTK